MNVRSSDRPRIAVVLVNYNGADDTIECLDSLASIMDDPKFAIVVDNNSSGMMY